MKEEILRQREAALEGSDRKHGKEDRDGKTAATSAAAVVDGSVAPDTNEEGTAPLQTPATPTAPELTVGDYFAALAGAFREMAAGQGYGQGGSQGQGA